VRFASARKRGGLTLAVVLELGCSPANVGGPGTTSGGLTVQQSCQDSAYARCMHLEDCSASALQSRYGNTTTCRAIFEQICANVLTAPSTGASPQQTELCATDIPNWTCSDFLFNENIPPSCQPALGQLSNGSSCADNQQCASGYCALPLNAACGTCQPVPAIGASCAQFVCPVSLTCVAGTQTCQAFLEVGAMCNADLPCNDGLTCVGATSTALGVCEQGVQTSNASCDFTGAGCDFYAGFACNALSSTCQTAVLAGPGQACGTVAYQATYCSNGSCIRGACEENIPVGGACNVDSGPPCATSSRCIVPADGGATGSCQLNGATVCP